MNSSTYQKFFQGVSVAISIQQPWAWLIVHGHKDVENRSWSTRKRGPVLIHAGQEFDDAGYEVVRTRFPQIAMPLRNGCPRGGIVGRAELVDCVSEHESPWFVGPFGFVFEDAEPLPLWKCRGRLGLFSPEL